MEDQEAYLKSIGIRMGSISEGEARNKQIEQGQCTIVFTPPESLLRNQRWWNMLASPVYQENLIGIAVDEAHCTSHW